MIHQSASDLCVQAYSPKTRLRMLYVDVTDSARALEQSHLCGPVAGLVQAEALAGIALLGNELAQRDETISLQMTFPNGAIGGLLVEAAADGSLRGYTNQKLLADLDASEEDDEAIVEKALGTQADCRIIRSIPGKILSHSVFTLENPTLTETVERYYDESLQRDAICQLSVVSSGGYLQKARGVLLDCLPDGDEEAFEATFAHFEDGAVQDLLDAEAGIPEIGALLGITDWVQDPPRKLTFACRCSREKIENAIAALSVPELEELAAKPDPTEIFCHMCGKGYSLAPAFLKKLLGDRRANAPGLPKTKRTPPPPDSAS